MENEQDMPFQNEGGHALDFFINVYYDFETSAFQLLFFLLFTFNKFYRFWDSTFVAFEIVQNEWKLSKI
jgi:hypothetical protein